MGGCCTSLLCLTVSQSLFDTTACRRGIRRSCCLVHCLCSIMEMVFFTAPPHTPALYCACKTLKSKCKVSDSVQERLQFRSNSDLQIEGSVPPLRSDPHQTCKVQGSSVCIYVNTHWCNTMAETVCNLRILYTVQAALLWDRQRSLIIMLFTSSLAADFEERTGHSARRHGEASIQTLNHCSECRNWDIFKTSCADLSSCYITFCENMVIPHKHTETSEKW